MPESWTTNSSKCLIKDRWLNLRQDSCITSSGSTVDCYYVVEIPDWVNIVAFDADDRILIIRQYRHGCAKVCIELPSGTIEKNDQSPITCARRELLEETGCSADSFEVISAFLPNPSRQPTVVHTVLALGAVKSREVQFDENEQITAEFIELPHLLRMIKDGTLSVGHSISSIFQVILHRNLSILSDR